LYQVVRELMCLSPSLAGFELVVGWKLLCMLFSRLEG
jgi:hypothetical protein